MKKIVLLFTLSLACFALHAQDTLPAVNSNIKTIKLKNRPGDHFMFQLSYDKWSGMPDSISSHQKGFSRGFNAYFMFDKPFRSAPKFSLGIGVGISTSNIFFKKMDVGVSSFTAKLPFTPLDSVNHFKKYKLATSYLEVPLEFRYTAKPDNYNKSLKAAIGLRLGTLVNAHTKGKNLLDKNNNAAGAFTNKTNSKRFINGTRFMATARIGYGIFNLFGAYSLSNVLKDGVGPEMKLYQVGITISGL